MDVSKIKVLMAEDSEDDVLLFSRALKRVGFENVQFVRDGREVLEYLQGIGKFENRLVYPFPAWLVLDLKMPKMNGLEVLQWLRSHPDCGIIPTIIFSSSTLPDDVVKVYQLRANTYFAKPNQFDELVKMLEILINYWCRAELPPAPTERRCA